jgi:hypothetical protein
LIPCERELRASAAAFAYKALTSSNETPCRSIYDEGIFDPYFTGSKLANDPMGAAAHISFGLSDKERKKLERVMPSKEAVAEFIK